MSDLGVGVISSVCIAKGRRDVQPEKGGDGAEQEVVILAGRRCPVRGKRWIVIE